MLSPFQISVSEDLLRDLHGRLDRARLPPEMESDWEDGTSPLYLRELVGYWRTRFNWRAQEAALNRFRHLRGEIDGTIVHLIHEYGRGPEPLPLLLTHGYPDSFWRFTKLIPLLADPGAYGGDPADAFDVVVPSLPGYAFSQARAQAGGIFGWGDLLHKLMTQELRYDRFAAHGGDWGSVVTELLARSHASSLVGIHLTDVPFFHLFQRPHDDEMSAAERTFFEKNTKWQQEEGAYAMIQGTRPRSLGPGLNDSPVGLAAWFAEKFRVWSDCGGDPERRFTKDELLTNISLYWFTGTIGSSFQPYRDFMKAGAMRWAKEWVRDHLGSDRTPAAFARFPADISQPPREWAERFFNVARWTEMPAGGHFAAFEEPEALAADIRAFFRPLRRVHT